MALRPSALMRSLAPALLAWAALAHAAGDAPPPSVVHEVRDPHYGDTLFLYFQGRDFTALTNLMVSQHFNRVSHHEEDAEVLRAGLLLSYGLHREAAEIFERLASQGTAPAVRDRAWFYLAKIRYQRGLADGAQQALDRIQGRLEPDLQEERVLLAAQLQMGRGDYAGAAATLQDSGTAEGKGARRLYARFNLGVALLRSGDDKRGTALLDEIGRMSAPDEETRSLRDRANLALGFSALQQEQQSEAAGMYLQRVRLNGLQASKALLGFGWSYAARQDYRHALVPWGELASRDAGDTAAQEARIAVGYAYAELGAFGQALERYEAAVADFDQEGRAIDESIASVRSGALVSALVERNPENEEMGWLWSLRSLPELPHAAQLAPLLAGHEFQEAFKNYRDLRFLSRNLDGWNANVVIYQDMIANRRLAFEQRLPRVREAAREHNAATVQQHVDTLSRDLAKAQEDSDGRAFATTRERELMERLDHVRQTLDRLGAADPEIAAEVEHARERHRLAAGALAWDVARAYPDRAWQAQKSLNRIQSDMVRASRADAALTQAQKDEPVRIAAFEKRLRELEGRIKALAPRVAALTREQQQAVQDIAVASLQQRKERLAIYATQARFAVAQIYDRATMTRKGDDAPAR